MCRVTRQGRYHTLVTAMFSHRDLFHLLSNMVTFYFFSPTALGVLGGRGFLQLYLGGGVFSSLTHVAWPYYVPSQWPAKYRTNRYTPALGASGAVNALVIYSIMVYPRQIIYVNLLLPMPAALFGALFVMKDVYELYQGGGSIGNAAHLGGAAFGAAFFLLRRSMRR